jgi:DNA-binding FadR family transcriptional regulator
MTMTKRPDILSNQVAEAMLRRILSEEFGPGSFLPSERELQEEYQVSRTVIREAIKLLGARGLITTNSRQGTIVNPDITEPVTNAMLLALHRSRAYVEDMVNTRILLEPPIAALAAQHATVVQIRELLSLSDNFTRMKVDPNQPDYEENRRAWLNNDRQFHILLAESTQNPVLPILVEVVHGMMWHQSVLVKYTVTLEHHNIVIHQHDAIARAIAEHDPETARQAMIEHLEYGRQYLAGILNNLVSLENGSMI